MELHRCLQYTWHWPKQKPPSGRFLFLPCALAKEIRTASGHQESDFTSGHLATKHIGARIDSISASHHYCYQKGQEDRINGTSSNPGGTADCRVLSKLEGHPCAHCFGSISTSLGSVEGCHLSYGRDGRPVNTSGKFHNCLLSPGQ